MSVFVILGSTNIDVKGVWLTEKGMSPCAPDNEVCVFHPQVLIWNTLFHPQVFIWNTVFHPQVLIWNTVFHPQVLIWNTVFHPRY